VPISGVRSSTVCSIIARCSRTRSRPRYRASAPRALRLSLNLNHPTRLGQLGLGALGSPLQLGDLRVASIGRLASPRTAERVQRSGIALLAPIRQMRRVQALAAQQRPDLTRRRTGVGLAHDPQLVLRRVPPSSGPLGSGALGVAPFVVVSVMWLRLHSPPSYQQ
jgi:hypothetical protein